MKARFKYHIHPTFIGTKTLISKALKIVPVLSGMIV